MEYAASTKEMRHAYKILVREPEVGRLQGVDVRITLNGCYRKTV
jgi:hypothetical protein